MSKETTNGQYAGMYSMAEAIKEALRREIVAGMEKYVIDVLTPLYDGRTPDGYGRQYNLCVVNRRGKVWQYLRDHDEEYLQICDGIEAAQAKLIGKSIWPFKSKALEETLDDIEFLYGQQSVKEGEASYKQGWADAIDILGKLLEGRVLGFNNEKNFRPEDSLNLWEDRHGNTF